MEKACKNSQNFHEKREVSHNN